MWQPVMMVSMLQIIIFVLYAAPIAKLAPVLLQIAKVVVVLLLEFRSIFIPLPALQSVPTPISQIPAINAQDAIPLAIDALDL